MSKGNKPENPPAFPVKFNTDIYSDAAGMKLRDYFAAKALQGILSAHAIFKEIAPAQGMAPPKLRMLTNEELSESAYKTADAMLKARQTPIA